MAKSILEQGVAPASQSPLCRPSGEAASASSAKPAAANAGHTPGPWSVERVDYELHGMDASYEVTAGRSVIVQTHMREIQSEGDLLATDGANCRLIAAAPELLEALEEALPALNAAQWQVDAEWRDYDKKAAQYEAIVRAFREKARAAIAKASGA
jgi:hypothetical protein